MRKMAGAVLLAAWIFAGCGGPPPVASPLSGRLGQLCKVQFRRGDALGHGGANAVPPTTDNINGADVSFSGTLSGAGQGWIVVSDGREDHVIREDAILLITFPAAAGKGRPK